MEDADVISSPPTIMETSKPQDGTRSSLLALHFLILDVRVTAFLEISDFNAASAAREDSSSTDGESDGDFLVAGKGGTDNGIAELALDVDAGAAVVLATGSTATKGKAGSTGLAAELKIQAAEPGLSRASGAISVLVETNIGATKGAAKDDVFFVNSVVTGHLVNF
eukprot:CAMPEP_0176069782 /NCGR_PEP_ID=MMETSP0120_2-20121206/34844_1 /TAXON_ID=160619 /ORGANISM="Kryptoperidinium foliaceum, Strain CCMP 1326" /LENGTH=165 /DNA_ID=CAMNT_0017403421 /DNA_START=123 /DNA_END=621 /DNA_ORIENTATION=-